MSSADEKKIAKLLVKYKSPERTKKDVTDLLKQYRLLYEIDKFVFNDGISKDLFNLHGTIPVNFKNNIYYIPICIWLMDTHPYNAPMCYVKPTPDMRINVSMFVDHNGKIYLPYLHDWKPQESDLLGVIQVMIMTFGENPPVFTKPKTQPVAYPNYPGYPPQGMTPGFGAGAGGGGPPYPRADMHQPMPGPPGAGYPPYPMSNFNNMPPYPLMPNAGGPATNTPYPPVPPPTTTPNAYPGYPPMPSPFNNGPGTAAGDADGVGMASQGTITEEHLKLSLISAIEDKIRRQVNERMNQYEAEMNTLRRTKDELLEGRSKIHEITSRLQGEERELQSNLTLLQGKDQELAKQLETLNKIDRVDVDEAVTTTAPLYKQLLNAYAEEAAIEDVIYYLGEALRTNVIDLEVFLKHVRQLSRKQFMLRALMQKCREKAGLLA